MWEKVFKNLPEFRNEDLIFCKKCKFRRNLLAALSQNIRFEANTTAQRRRLYTITNDNTAKPDTAISNIAVSEIQQYLILLYLVLLYCLLLEPVKSMLLCFCYICKFMCYCGANVMLFVDLR